MTSLADCDVSHYRGIERVLFKRAAARSIRRHLNVRVGHDRRGLACRSRRPSGPIVPMRAICLALWNGTETSETKAADGHW
ncbi:hypothetical protein BSFA1_74310 (plasmid) [Burkholderia sp. SFA1]|nr:hypothetical protein BSFA1_74310 [Burkholderia sp. SFA1]